MPVDIFGSLILVVVLGFTARKGYGRLVGALIVLNLFRMIPALLHIPGYWDEMTAAICLATILFVSGLLLRRNSIKSFKLYFVALTKGSKNFTLEEKLLLFKFDSTLRVSLWQSTTLMITLASIAVFVGRLLRTNSRVFGMTTSAEIISFIIPVLMTFFINSFLLRVLSYKWFDNIPGEVLSQDNSAVPFCLWLLPVLVVLIVFTPELIDFIGPV